MRQILRWQVGQNPIPLIFNPKLVAYLWREKKDGFYTKQYQAYLRVVVQYTKICEIK